MPTRAPLLALSAILGILVQASSCSHSTPGGEAAARTASDALIPKLGAKALDFDLKTLAGRPVRLSTLTSEGPVVLIVLRGWNGYQCPICTTQIGEFISQADALEAARAHVLLVYPGAADRLLEHAEEFTIDKDLPKSFTFIVDPDLVFTSSYGLRWTEPGETAYPSTFVIDRGGIVRFAKTSRSHGDRASASEVLEALKSIGR
jgi:peroxiredoxin